MRKNYLLPFLYLLPFIVAAQPANDQFAQVEVIPVPQNFNNLGKFQSLKIPLKLLSREMGESFHPLLVSAGMDRKSAWYKFTLVTGRSVSVEVMQKDTMIPQNAVGLAVYEEVSGMPNLGNISKKLTAISKFGSSSNNCLHPGVYYIQLCSRFNETDTVWLTVDVKTPVGLLYDRKATPYDFGSVSGNKNTILNVGCLSIDDSAEMMPALGSDYTDYTQSAWFMIRSDNYTELMTYQVSVNGIAAYGKTPVKWGYRIYKGNIVQYPAGLPCIDSGVVSPNFYKLADSLCKILPTSYYTIQLIFHKKDEYQIYVSIQELGEFQAKAPNPTTIPSTHKLGVLNKNVNIITKDYLSCNAQSRLNLCGTVSLPYYPDSVFNSSWDDDSIVYSLHHVDTLDLATWVTFQLSEKGNLRIDPRRITPNNNNYYLDKIRLFAGDVSSNCHIPMIYEHEGYDLGICLDAGTYSMQLLGRSEKGSAQYGNTQLGHSIQTTLHFKPSATQLAATYDTTTAPDILGDITSQAKAINGYFTRTYHVGGPTDTMMIGGKQLFGRFTFVQFHLSEKMNLDIKCLASNPYYFADNHILLKGKATAISDSSALIPAQFGAFGLRCAACGMNLTSNCLPLDTGWYTLVAQSVPVDCSDRVIGFSFQIKRILYNDQPRYNTPQKALLINNGTALDWAANYGTTVYPRTRANYYIATHFFGCSPDTPLPVSVSCLGGTYINYYVFRIKNNGTFLKFRKEKDEQDSYDYHVGNHALYKANVLLDSNALSDTSRIVSRCGNGYISYCNLDSGTYTLVLTKSNSGNVPIGFNFYLVLDKKYTSAFESARTANDLGLIPQTNVEKMSQPDFISCNTSMDTSNPGMNNFRPQPTNAPNILHKDQEFRKNVWYTFLLSGTGDVNIKGYLYNNNSFSPYSLAIYKSDDVSGLAYQQLIDSGYVDSTLKQGLSLVGYGGGTPWGSPPVFAFKKLGCETIRYYVLVISESQFRDVYQVQLGIKYNGISYPELGDKCSNAIPLQLSSPSSVSASTLVNCHTIGESFGEDGSNMGCLGKVGEVKTSWFKFTYSGSVKMDLTFSITNQTNAPSSLIRYRVLYGSCNSMTPGPCVENAQSSFRLDCMAPGDYYIQVSTPLATTGNIKITATATATVYPVCKPFDLAMPFAYFTVSGECNKSLVSFANISSQGNNIIYKWDFGNGTFSSSKSPQVTFQHNQSIDTFQVKLVVTDTVSFKADSVIIPVYMFKDSVWINAGNDLKLKCAEKNFLINGSTNFPYPVFEWQPANLLDNPYALKPKLLAPSDVTLKVKMIAENCTLYDSMRVTVDRYADIQGDTLINCYSGVSTLNGPPGYDTYIWTSGSQSTVAPSLQINKPGKYMLRAYNGVSCWAYDTIIVTGVGGSVVNVGPDQVLCHSEQVQLYAPVAGSRLWSTGATDSVITVGQAGQYWVSVTSGSCVVTDSVKIEKYDISVELGTDKSICEGDSVKLSAMTSGNVLNYLWSTADTTSSLMVKAGALYRITVKSKKCEETDSVSVQVLPAPKPKLPADTMVCEGNEVQLDMQGTYDTYQWSGGESTPGIHIKTSGLYWVRVSKDGCFGSDSVNVTARQALPFSVGTDTAFCGNFLLKLDGGKEGAFYRWEPGGDQAPYIYASEYGTYILTRTDTSGCVLADTIHIKEVCDPTIFVPTAFTPNNSNLNEVFKAICTDMDWFQLIIYNRWGEKVFESHDPDHGWNGTYEGQACQQDVYPWLILYKGKTGRAKTLSGTVTLLR